MSPTRYRAGMFAGWLSCGLLLTTPWCVHAQHSAECQLPQLRKELGDRVEKDQQMRKKLIEKMNTNPQDPKGQSAEVDTELVIEMHNVDQANTAWLKEQIETHGWLGKSLVGTDGAHNAWLLVQHADAQPDFQQRCLDLMNAMPEGEVAGQDVAYLTDRVLVAAGKPQRYGTQVQLENGRPVVKNVEDEANLDSRRSALGMEPMDEYLQLIEKAYSTQPSSGQTGADAADVDG